MVGDLPYYLPAACRLIYLGLLALLLVRVEFGPVKGIISARSTLNIAAFAFLALAGLTVFAGSNRDLEGATLGKRSWPLFAAILAPIPLWALNALFLFDDYVHLATAAQESWQAVVHRSFLDHPIGGDGFFRPLGNLYFWVNFRWAGWSTEAWHACSLVHTCCQYPASMGLLTPNGLFVGSFFFWNFVLCLARLECGSGLLDSRIV